MTSLLPPREEVDSLIGQAVRGRFAYRIEGLLGQGGTGSVYRGLALVRSQPVAIKVLHARSAAIPEMARRFQREVATSQRLVHPNVVEVSDSGTLDDGSLFMVMELLEGQSLDGVIARGALEPVRAIAIARQILSALDEAHALGIVHRDVKSSNVFLLERDGVDTVKLFDFGIALNDRAAVKLSIAGAAFGTPEYMSPEMARGDKVDGRADLYSLGVLLFEMLTGRLPFVREDPLDLLRDHLSAAPPAPRSLKPELPPALDALVLRALAKLPTERFASAAEMRAALGELDAVPRSYTRVLLLVLLLAAIALAAILYAR